MRTGVRICKHLLFRNTPAVIPPDRLQRLSHLPAYSEIILNIPIPRNLNSVSRAVRLNHSGMLPKKITGRVFTEAFTFIIPARYPPSLEQKWVTWLCKDLK